jgi:hypothetical protein
LLGLPLGATGEPAALVPAALAPDETAAPLTLETPPPGIQEESDWLVANGEILVRHGATGFRPDGREALTYNNPFQQRIERVWFDDKIVFAVDVGEVDVDPARVKVAQEYQIVYAVELDEQGKKKREPEAVDGQYNIYDSVPGMAEYSPIWQFNYVVVPRGYVPNTLRSARSCEESGYPIIRSQDFEN